jgi:hypothetical protein
VFRGEGRPGSRQVRSRGAKFEAGADAVGDVGIGHASSESLGGAPAGAVGGDDRLRADLGQSVDGGFESGTAEVEPSDDGRDGVDAGEALGVPDDVDDPGVFVADKDHQAVAGEEPIYLKLLRS